MDMWVKIFVLLAVVVAVYRFLRRRRQADDSGKSRHNILADIPNRVLNPSSYRNIQLIVAWEFVAPNLSRSCQYARDHAGIRKEAGSCTPLPLADCGSDACLCHYRPIFDERRRGRRKEHDRRSAYRMDDKQERRTVTDRRNENRGWNDENMK
jgi:hypothetical protein